MTTDGFQVINMNMIYQQNLEPIQTCLPLREVQWGLDTDQIKATIEAIDCSRLYVVVLYGKFLFIRILSN